MARDRAAEDRLTAANQAALDEARRVTFLVVDDADNGQPLPRGTVYPEHKAVMDALTAKGGLWRDLLARTEAANEIYWPTDPDGVPAPALSTENLVNELSQDPALVKETLEAMRMRVVAP